MAFFNKYPYNDFHELNLDWIISEVKRVEKVVDDFTVFNTLTWAGEWNASKSYVKWSIVQDNSGNGYIAIKAVPTNVPLTNEEYWQLIAKYSDLYAAFNARIAALETTVGDASSGIIKDINDINTNIDNIEDDILDIDTHVSNISANTNKKCIFIGDSYGLSLADSGNRWNGWGYMFAAAFPDVACYISAVGGSGFIGDPNVDNFYTQLVHIGASIDDKDGITDIVVLGGYNDASLEYSYNDIITAMKTFSSYARTNYKNAKIHCGFIAIDYNNTGMQTTLNLYARYYQDACPYAGISYIANANYILLDKSLLYDAAGDPNRYFHPSSGGNGFVAFYLAQYLFSGYFDVLKTESFGGCDVYVKNGQVSITNSQNSRVFNWLTGAVSIPFNTWTDIADVSLYGSNLVWFPHDPNLTGSFTARVYDASGNDLGTFRLRIVDKKVQIIDDYHTSGTTATGWSFQIGTLTFPFEKAY